MGAYTHADTAPKRAAVFISSDSQYYRIIAEGFKEEGGNTYESFIYPLEENLLRVDETLEAVRSVKPAALFAIGDFALRSIAGKTGDVPLVYTGVFTSDPLDYQIMGTGVSVYVEPKQVFEMLALLTGIKRIGIIHKGLPWINRYVQRIEETAPLYDMSVHVETVNQGEGMQSYIFDRFDDVDCVWVMMSPFFLNERNLRRLTLWCNKNKVLLIVPDRAFLYQGGMIAVQPDYKDLGRQCGEIARDLMKGRLPLRKNILRPPRKTKKIYNLRTPSTVITIDRDRVRKIGFTLFYE